MSSKKELKEVIHQHATIRIGKNGLTQGIIEEIKKQLEKRKIVKVRIGIKIDEDRREFARKVAELTNSELVEVRGFTFILRKND